MKKQVDWAQSDHARVKGEFRVIERNGEKELSMKLSLQNGPLIYT